MREGPSAILAVRHRRDMPAVEADQQNGARDPLAAWAEPDLPPPMLESESDLHFSMAAPGGAQRALDFGAVRANGLPLAIDDDLRGIDGGEPEELGITTLALGRSRAGERVLPAEPVPVVDMERECQHLRTARELGQQRIGRRTRGATLGGEELDNDRPFAR